MDNPKFYKYTSKIIKMPSIYLDIKNYNNSRKTFPSEILIKKTFYDLVTALF